MSSRLTFWAQTGAVIPDVMPDREAFRAQYPAIYVAGPMRGYLLHNFPAFDDAAATLRSIGWTVFNPAEIDRSLGFDETRTEGYDFDVEAALRRDVRVITECDAIALLPGWERSSGAAVEWTVAKAIGLEIVLVDNAVHPGSIGR